MASRSNSIHRPLRRTLVLQQDLWTFCFGLIFLVAFWLCVYICFHITLNKNAGYELAGIFILIDKISLLYRKRTFVCFRFRRN